MAFNPLDLIRRLLPPEHRAMLDAIVNTMMADAPPKTRRSPAPDWRVWLKQTLPMLSPSQIEALIDYARAAAKAAGKPEPPPDHLPAEPKSPGANASPQELAEYEKATKRYDRMMELMSSIIKKRDELQMSIIRKM